MKEVANAGHMPWLSKRATLTPPRVWLLSLFSLRMRCCTWWESAVLCPWTERLPSLLAWEDLANNPLQDWLPIFQATPFPCLNCWGQGKYTIPSNDAWLGCSCLNIALAGLSHRFAIFGRQMLQSSPFRNVPPLYTEHYQQWVNSDTFTLCTICSHAWDAVCHQSLTGFN